MEPADTIIRICGGVDAVARITGRDRSNVHRWAYSVERGGTGGLIPSDAEQKLMRHARANDLPLRPDHFFPDLPAGAEGVGEISGADEAA